LLAREAAVHARLPDPERVRDVLKVGVAVAVAREDPGGGREDAIAPGILGCGRRRTLAALGCCAHGRGIGRTRPSAHGTSAAPGPRRPFSEPELPVEPPRTGV